MQISNFYYLMLLKTYFNDKKIIKKNSYHF